MPKATSQPKLVTVTVNFRAGPVSPAMRRAWVTFWQRIIAEAKRQYSFEVKRKMVDRLAKARSKQGILI